MYTPILVAGVSLALAGAASADTTLVTVTYADLSGNYASSSATTGTFSAFAVDAGLLHSSGDVSRVVSPVGTADFQPGFVSGADLSDFVLSMAVTHGTSTGTGAGTFTATDADGDTITGSLGGTWGLSGGFLAFVGTLSGVSINDNGTLDATFNGSNTGSWSMSGLPASPYNGAIVQLTANVAGFFAGDFSAAATGTTAQITIPLPPAAYTGLGMLGALSGLGRLRRRAGR